MSYESVVVDLMVEVYAYADPSDGSDGSLVLSFRSDLVATAAGFDVD